MTGTDEIGHLEAVLTGLPQASLGEDEPPAEVRVPVATPAEASRWRAPGDAGDREPRRCQPPVRLAAQWLSDVSAETSPPLYRRIRGPRNPGADGGRAAVASEGAHPGAAAGVRRPRLPGPAWRGPGAAAGTGRRGDRCAGGCKPAARRRRQQLLLFRAAMAAASIRRGPPGLPGHPAGASPGDTADAGPRPRSHPGSAQHPTVGAPAGRPEQARPDSFTMLAGIYRRSPPAGSR
jgi:hypothetical protein